MRILLYFFWIVSILAGIGAYLSDDKGSALWMFISGAILLLIASKLSKKKKANQETSIDIETVAPDKPVRESSFSQDMKPEPKPIVETVENSPPVDDEPLRCPKCGSTQLQADKKGYGAGKALTGVLFTGGIGLLGGFIGSKKLKITCLKCGKRWKPGKI